MHWNSHCLCVIGGAAAEGGQESEQQADDPGRGAGEMEGRHKEEGEEGEEKVKEKKLSRKELKKLKKKVCFSDSVTNRACMCVCACRRRWRRGWS